MHCYISGSFGGEYEVTVFWDMAPCVWLNYTDVSEVRTAPIITAMMEAVRICDTSINARLHGAKFHSFIRGDNLRAVGADHFQIVVPEFG
jgi:hypothetical protein